ncbi:MAG: ABC transporter substrate-binding protein [Eubacterium sp.]|nr:ABC transporter substrate-binding protein [Eubacterium sp.]
MNRTRVLGTALAGIMLAMCAMTGCGSDAGEEATSSQTEAVSTTETSSDTQAPEIEGLTYESTVDLEYATEFDVYKYEDGYALIDISEEGQFLYVPSGQEAPQGLSEDITVINEPSNIYLAATAEMALFNAMDALDVVTMTSLDTDGWTFDAPIKALESGAMTYAGKYSQPDYEVLLANNCDLAIESTMIYHTPEVQEMIEDLDIPVLVDRSSYESNPLGRMEWIKLYAVLTGHEEDAQTFFEAQEDKIATLEDFENTGKTVAFFYISTDNKAVCRASTDYVPTMISMAGGQYIFSNLVDEEGRSSVNMSIEAFYDAAQDADYIVYNGSIDSTVKTMDDLLAKDPSIADLKAVKEGNCWVTGSSLYQRTDIISDMILDFHTLLTEEDPKGMEFITKLE